MLFVNQNPSRILVGPCGVLREERRALPLRGAGSSHPCTLRTPPSRPITHCVHMRTQLLPVSYTACTFARSCVRFRTQLRAFLHAARVVGTVLARVITLLTPPYARCVRAYAACLRPRFHAACMRTQRADRRRGPPGRNQPTRLGGQTDPELMRAPSARQVDSSTRSTWSTAAE